MNTCLLINLEISNFQYVAGYWSLIRALRQSDQGDIADILENTVWSSTEDLPRERLRTYQLVLNFVFLSNFIVICFELLMVPIL